MCDQQSLRSACAYAQTDQSPCLSLEYSLIVKLLTEHHLEFLTLKGGCRGSSESTHVKMLHCWISHALAHLQTCKISASYVERFIENAEIIVPYQNCLPFESRYALSTSCVFWLISNDVINLSFSEIKLFFLYIP